jgi:hypothetical protein
MKNLCLTLLLLCSAAGFAQTGFVEVTVTDTVWIKPTAFDYNITVKENWDIYPDNIDADFNEDQVMAAIEADRKQKMEVLKAFLNKKKYAFRELENQEYGVIDPGTGYGYSITLTNGKELQRLKDDLKTLDYVNGTLGKAISAPEAVYDTAIYTKLMKRARAKAEAIGTAGGQKPGRVLEVTEVEAAKPDNFNVHDTYFVVDNGGLTVEKNGFVHGEMTKTLVVKFTVE